jgi:hypothetical protein
MVFSIVLHSLLDETQDCIFQHRRYRLSTDTEIELFVVIASQQDHETDSLFYLNSLGVSGKFVSWQDWNPTAPITFTHKFAPIPYEGFACYQRHVDQAIVDALASHNADILLINYLYSAMICSNAIKKAPRAVLVNLNRETAFYWDFLKRVKKSWFKRFIKTMSLFRVWRAEQSIFRLMDKIIALSPPDVPKRKGMYITPYLDANLEQWKPNSSRTLFFVGNIGHHPNREAIEYIITKLAPAVSAIIPDVRFKIIGACADDVSFHHPSVDLLGKSDAAEVERQFLNCQLFICPVKNTFGLKFKMAEALSYGTPFMASPESMLCFPHLKDQPSIPLDDPQQAARNIAASILDESTTTNLATSINFQHRQFMDSQHNIWSRSLRDLRFCSET